MGFPLEVMSESSQRQTDCFEILRETTTTNNFLKLSKSNLEFHSQKVFIQISFSKQFRVMLFARRIHVHDVDEVTALRSVDTQYVNSHLISNVLILRRIRA